MLILHRWWYLLTEVEGHFHMSRRKTVYLDYHATTPMDPRCLEAVLPYFSEEFGNTHSSTHEYGWRAEQAVRTAREQVAQLLGAEEQEVIFTSGATESNNLALLGVARANRSRGTHIISVETEHKSVLDVLKRLEKEGFEVSLLRPDSCGRISVESVAKVLRPDTILLSVMAANNEIGTIHPIKEIGALAKEREIYFFSDITQAVGKFPITVQEFGLDLCSLSAHKIYGPKGVGALYVRRRDPRVALEPLFHGGGHERGYRPGTLNVSGIVGMGRACQLLQEEGEEERKKLFSLRERLYQGILDVVPDVEVNGHPEHRLCNNLNIFIPGIPGELLALNLRELAISSSSACSSADSVPSHVLQAIGRNPEEARACFRFSVGRFTTEEEVHFAIETVKKAVTTFRAKSSL